MFIKVNQLDKEEGTLRQRHSSVSDLEIVYRHRKGAQLTTIGDTRAIVLKSSIQQSQTRL